RESEPVLLAGGRGGRNRRPRPVEPLAVQPHRKPAVLLLLEQLVRPGVPDLDGARAVVSLRNLPLEASVFQRVILDVNREMLLAGLERNALRHRPRREHAAALETEGV